MQSRQSNGNVDHSCPSNDLPASLLYLSASTNRCPVESSKNPCLTNAKLSCSLQKNQFPQNSYTSQPNISVYSSSSDDINSTKEKQQQSQQTGSSNHIPQSSMFTGNPVINSSVWTAWASGNKLLPENRVSTNTQSWLPEKSQHLSNFDSSSQVTSTSSLSISSTSTISDGHLKTPVHSECSRNPVCTLSTESRKANVAHRIGPLITLAGVDGSFRLPAVLPEFHFKESPFFKLIDVLLPPQIILPAHIGFATGRRSYDRSLALRFTSDQVETITYHCWRGVDERMEFGVQVIMRFARLDPQACQDLVQIYELPGGRKSSSLSMNKPIKTPLAEDSLPVHLIIQVNGRPIQLPPLLPSNRPGMDGRRNPRPINITQSLHVSPTVPNYIKLTWTHDYATFTYNVVGIYLMRRRSPQQLCGLLHSTSFHSANIMRMEIIKKLSPNATVGNSVSVHNQSHSSAFSEEDDDDLVMPNTLPVHLLCPLSKCRIEVPVRGRNCRHVQCYDATTYLIINERKPTWNCPVCDGKAAYEDLIVDGSATDSVGSSSLAPSFNALSPTNSVNSSSTALNSYANSLPLSPSLTVRTATVAPTIRNDVNNTPVPNIATYQTSLTVQQSSQDKEQNQQINPEPSSFTIDLTLSDDENEQECGSARESASSIHAPTKNINSTSHSYSSSSSLSPQFPPSDLSQSSHFSESSAQLPISSHINSKQSSTVSSNISYPTSYSQSLPVPPTYPSELHCTQSGSVYRNIGSTTSPIISISSNQRRYPPVSSEREVVHVSPADVLRTIIQSEITDSSSTASSGVSKRPSLSDYSLTSLNLHQSGDQAVNNNGSRCSSTTHSTSFFTNESIPYSLPSAKVPRHEISHSQYCGSSSDQCQGLYSRNSNGNNSRCTNSPSGSNSYTYHPNITRQPQSDGYRARLTSSSLHSGHSYNNETTTGTNSRYTYYNPDESNNSNSDINNRAYNCYSTSRHVSYPAPDPGTVYSHNGQFSSHIRNPYSCYDTHHRSAVNNPLSRSTLHHNSQQVRSDTSNSAFYGNTIDSRRGFH
ncbi:E3 SUMO-protein ligase PIAS1 [Schistosoma japonicum]|nr:E3 SUMO-protein ligase PIAS1 [Schistosoma japonicum]KAH8850408.1 E3 SUMO-protein ligase PIAS1 [Schistosoma japonicum]